VRRYLFIGIVGVIVAAAAIVLTYWPGEESVPEPKLADGTTGSAAPSDRSARDNGIPVPKPPPMAVFKPGSGRDAASPPAANGAGATSITKAPPAASPAEKPGTVPSPGLPVFDVVRVNPEGDAVIAGRAEPGAKVGIYDGDKLTGTVVADNRGEWVFLPTEPLPAGQRELSLALIDKDGNERRSPSAVVLAVPERKVAGAPAAEQSAPGPTSSQQAATAKQDGVLAVLVSRDGTAPSRVLQKPSEETGVGDKSLSVDVIDYDDKGNITIGGKGSPGETIQVYIDNGLVSPGIPVTPEGTWYVAPKSEVGIGVHRLRVDSLAGNKVVARVEMPFSRAEPPSGMTAEMRVVVQPGNSLWRIARRTLGSGFRYTEIYQANQSQIVDPDLIYPGQVFSLPQSH
jgi:nucleoid-associated protein YgaU